MSIKYDRQAFKEGSFVHLSIISVLRCIMCFKAMSFDLAFKY